MVNQFEYHPLRTAENLVGYMRSKGIRIQSYAPLCRLVTPLRESQFLKDLCQKYNKSLGQIILRWHVQQGDDMPVFKSYRPSRFAENIDVFDFSLTEDEFEQISSLNQDYKYHIESVPLGMPVSGRALDRILLDSGHDIYNAFIYNHLRLLVQA